MTSILIIGGGIGGLSAALAFRKLGIEAQVYERAATPSEFGAAISLWPNATRVLRHLGVLDSLVQQSHIPPAANLRHWRGATLRQMTAFQTDAPSLFTHRASLHACLLAAVPASQIHFGKAFKHLEMENGKVRAHFTDGSESPWSDGLVGADGARSMVREQLLRDGEPRYRGYVAWRGVATFPSDGIVGESWGRGQRFGFIPLGGDRVGWWSTANDRSPEETLKQTPRQWKAEVRRLFAGWHAPIPKVIEATPDDAVLCNMICDRESSATWGDGVTTLLGDAAHPSTPNLGQGGCMAIEDAAVLARAVYALPKLSSAFRVYEATRRERTANIVRESRKLGHIGQWHNPLACRLRDFMMHLASEKRFQKIFQELWIYDAWTASLVMPQ